MVKEALGKIRQAEEKAGRLAEKAREDVSADLLQASRDAEEIVKNAEAESRQRAKAILSEAQKENERIVQEIRENTDKEREGLRASGGQHAKEAIHFVKEKFTSQWQ